MASKWSEDATRVMIKRVISETARLTRMTDHQRPKSAERHFSHMESTDDLP